MANKIPNLDVMPESELLAFWRLYKRPSATAAEALVGHKRRGYLGEAKLLAAYAANKATAMNNRLRGDIRMAINYENVCETIYNQLPKRLRW